MLLFGRLIVTLQPVAALWLAVPPGHSAESNKPNELTLRTRESVRGLGLDKNYKFKVPGGMDRAVLDYMKDRID